MGRDAAANGTAPSTRTRYERLSGAPPVVRARRTARDWPSRYAGWLLYSDIFVVAATLTAFAGVLIPSATTDVNWPGGPSIPYWAALVAVGLTWLFALAVWDTRERHIVGNGILEYRRTVNATIGVFAGIASLAFFLKIDVSRALLLVGLPVGLVLLVFSRWMWRQWLRRQQRKSKYVYRTIVLGEPVKVGHVITAIRRAHGSGFEIVGVATSGHTGPSINGVPVVGGFESITTTMDVADADTVVIAGSDDLDPPTMRRLGWDIADRDGNLVVAPALTDVGGPRIHTRPAAGLPLVHVEFPELEGTKRFIKRAFDLVAATLLIVVLSPVMLIITTAVAIDSRGPVIYRQVRAGRRGREFGMLKFRSMAADADDQLASLLDLQGTSDTPLFKVNDDPRISRVGRVLRKHSLDELPQLFNVFVGQMSLVGPRPQRAAEVALYDEAARRRMLVKPGMSGLWQVSGRSTLSWDDALRLDLYYVENWSFTQDIQILFRTIRAVLMPGASAH